MSTNYQQNSDIVQKIAPYLNEKQMQQIEVILNTSHPFDLQVFQVMLRAICDADQITKIFSILQQNQRFIDKQKHVQIKHLVSSQQFEQKVQPLQSQLIQNQKDNIYLIKQEKEASVQMLQIINIDQSFKQEDSQQKIMEQKNSEQLLSSVLKSNQLVLIVSDQTQTVQNQIMNLVDSIIDQSLIAYESKKLSQITQILNNIINDTISTSNRNLQLQMNTLLNQIINSSFHLRTYIYPPVPYKKKSLYTRQIDELNRNSNVFFTNTNSLEYSRWQLLLVIIANKEIKEITVFSQKIFKLNSVSQKFGQYFIHFYTIQMFDNLIPFYQIKFKQKDFWSEQTFKFKIKDCIQMYRGKSIAIYDLIDEQQQVNLITNYSLLLSIKYLTKFLFITRQTTITQIYSWLKLISDNFSKQLPISAQNALFGDRSMFMGVQVGDLYIYLLYGIYREKASLIIDRYNIIKKMDMKSFNIRKWQKSIHYQQMQLLYLQYYLYNRLGMNNINQELVDTILRNNLNLQSKNIIKRIIFRCSIESAYILARSNQLVSKILLKNQQFSVQDFLLIKSRYLFLCFKQISQNTYSHPYYRARQLQAQDTLIIMFLADLIEKNQTSPKLNENKQIQLSKQGLKNIFFKTIKGWVTNGYQLRISENKFCDMYQQLKKLLKINIKIGQIIFNTLFIKLQNHYPVLLQKYSVKLIILMLINPVLQQQDQSLSNYLQKHKFTNFQANELIDHYLGNVQKISETRFLDAISKIAESNQFQFYSIFKKSNQILQIPNYPHKNIFKKIFVTLLQSLRISINEKIISKHIKSSFILNDRQLRIDYIKRICEQIKRQIKYDEHFYNIINRSITYNQYEKRDLFISIYFENQHSNIEEVQQKLWACLVKNIQYLPSIKTRFRISFQPSAKRIMNKIQENKLTSQELNALKSNLNQMKQHLQRDFINLIEDSFAKKQKFYQQLKLIQYILQKCQNLSEIASYFLRKQSDIKTKTLQQIYFAEIGDDQKWLFQFCQQIRILMSYQFSTLQKSSNIDQFKIQFAKQKNQLLIIYQKFKSYNINVEQLHKYFVVNLVVDFCDIFCKDKQIRQYIIKCANKLHMKSMLKLQQYVKSYLNLLKCLQIDPEKQSNYELFIKMVQQIQGDPAQVQVLDSVRLIELIQKQMSEVYGIGIDVKNPLSLIQQLQKNQTTHIVRCTYLSMALFDMIQTRKIDQRSIADLKEYINDQENSSLRLDSIKQFENVLDYWTIVRRSKSVIEYINTLQEKVEKSQGQIWRHIDNCYSIYRLIDQKLDEAANRETSFKYEIEAIFQNSTLSIKKTKDTIDIEVITTPLLTNVSLINRQLIVQYKRLETFKDKSILLISDIERQQNQDENIKKTLSIFKRFEEYFRIVQNIHSIVKQLLSYGYNTQFIIINVQVNKNDFKELLLKEQQLQKMCSQWVKGIKQLYKQSYLLTHFIGSQLSIFINRCLNNQYHSSLHSILKLTQPQFNQKTRSDQFKNQIKLAAKSQPLQQIISIVKLYLVFQDNIRKNKGVKDGKIVVESVSEKYYYCCFLQENKVSQSNRVFYCLQQTKTQQIEVFLWRALIDSSRVYYFIGVHNLKQQIKLYFWNQFLYLLQYHKQAFQTAKFTFVDSLTTDKFYSFLFKSKLFNIVKNQPFDADLQSRTKKMIDLLPSTWIVQSAKAGLGKTFRIEQLAHLQQKTVRYFPISGNVQFIKLANRLKKLKLKQSQCLSISLFQVQDWRKIQVFLSELILFRCFYYEQFVFLPEDLWIFVEIQNIHQQKQQDMYPLIGLLTKYGQGIFIKQFQINLISFDAINDQQKFVLLYLDILNQPGVIATKQLYFVETQLYEIPQNAHMLIQKYFLSWFVDRNQHPTFTGYKSFMKMLFKTFKAFSECEYLRIQNVTVADAEFQYLQFNKFREAFLNICIQNVLQFLQQTYSSNDFSSNQGFQTFHERMNKINMLILPSTKIGNYQFIYTSQENVPLCIKSILLTQNYKYFNKIKSLKKKQQIHQLFYPTALNNLDQYSLQQKLQHMLLSIADQVMDQNIPPELKAYYYPNFDQYKLTLDNFIKICLIWHRASSGIPCILMGESGVGKTKLISFFVQQVLKNVLIVINLHAGIHQDQLTAQVQKIKKAAEDWGIFNRIWVFFDEFNTCDELGYIKQMVIDHRFMGQPLPQNLIIVAACNPYRKKRKGKLIQAGIKRPDNNQSQLAFTVKAPPISMVQLIWDYQQLKSKEMKIYIEKMLEKINYSKKQKLIDSIVYTHQFLKDNVQISSASLRDVARFKKVYEWFNKFMPTSGEKNSKRINPNYKMDRSQRCIILTYSFCYCLRLATNQQRQHLYQKIESNLNFPKGWMKRVVFNEQIDYVSRLTISDEKIALNTALIENVFTCLVCLLNKIPILLIGNPGSSKSLSMRLIQSNMRGKGSQSQFCSQFPQLNVLYFQGSQSSTSKGVEQIFEKALRWKSQANKKWQIQQCILFDQIGLAEKSIHNPLKVLHSKLQTSSQQICFIGISNWQLDLAKMSRFLVLARSNPDKKDLAETAKQIALSFLGASQETQFIDYQISQRNWQSLGEHYYNFIHEWQKKSKNKKHFFGLRDFYGYVKFICSEVIKQKGKMGSFQRAIDKSIQINFDGQHGSVQLFKNIVQSSSQSRISPLQLIQFNLQRPQSRCLLIIVKGDSLVPLINKGISLGGQRKMICIHGSTFNIDQESEEYNQEMTALTINHISRGNVLAFKDINNSIQTSLYDLFNKSFTKVGDKRYCRIAVGANSNPKCLVHHNFNAIVYIDQARLEVLDPPFLNRFQKHYLNIKNMINNEEIYLVQEIKRWMEETLSFRSKESILKTQQFLINSGEQSIITLVIKHKKTENAIQAIKKDLLLNQTTDFIIGLDKNEYFKQQQQQLQKYNFTKNQDYIIFTYDEFLNLSENSIFQQGFNIHIQQIQSEKELRALLKKSINEERKNIQIYLNYQNHRQHLSFILFLIDQLKTSFDIQKQFFVIIQMHRFSLHHLKIDHINISYLHPFKQVFMQTLNIHKKNQLNYILKTKNYYQTYKILEMNKSFSAHFTEIIKCCKFMTLQQRNQSLSRLYFEECLLLRQQKYFVQSCLKSIENILRYQQIDFKLLQHNNQAIISCSNILQAIEKHIQDKVKQIIFNHLKIVIQKGLLFHFNSNVWKHQKHISQSFIMEYKLNKDFMYTLAKEQFKQYIQKVTSKVNYQFKKGILQNIIIISEEFYLLPNSKSQFNHILNQNSPTFKQKISIQSSTQQEISDTIKNQRQLIEVKSKISKIYHRQSPQIKSFIEKCSILDILTYILSTKNRKRYNIQTISEYLLNILSSHSIQQKIVLIGFDFTLTILLLDLLQSLSLNEQIAKLALDKISFNISQGLKRLIKNIAFSVLQHLSPSISTINKFKSIQDYSGYFSNIYQNITAFNVSFTIFQETYIQKVQMLHHFLIFIHRLKQNTSKTMVQEYQTNKQSASISENIFDILYKNIVSIKDISIREQSLTFLSNHIVSIWIKEKKLLKNQLYANSIEIYLKLVNQNPIIANKSAPIFEIILQFGNQFHSLTKCLQQIKNKRIQQIEQIIDFKNYVSVALGFYFGKIIKKSLQIQFKSNLNNEQQSTTIIREHFDNFKHVIEYFHDQDITKMNKIGIIEFSKVYCSNYLIELTNNQNKYSLLDEIDNFLCKPGQIMEHLRLYMTKCLVARYGNLQKVRRYFIEMKRCNWILNMRELLQEERTQIILPITPKDKDYSALLLQFSKSNFTNIECFHQIIREGLTTSEKTYLMLTYFFTTFYMRNSPQQYISLLIEQIQGRQDLNTKEFLLIKKIIIMYLRHKICKSIQFDFKRQDNTLQIILINYINVILSCRKINSPLSEMFFNEKGQIPRNYSQWIRQRYLIGSMDNPAAQRIRYLLSKYKGDAFGYYIVCNQKSCSYTTPVGGFFSNGDENMGCGSLDPGTVFKCNLCGKLNKILQNNEYQGKIVDQKGILAERQLIQATNSLFYNKDQQNHQLLLKGYHFGTSLQQIRQILNLKQHFFRVITDYMEPQPNLVNFKILQSIIYFVWQILSETEEIQDKQLASIFGIKQRQLTQFFIQGSRQLLKSAHSSIGFKDKQEVTIWHFAFAQQLFNKISNKFENSSITLYKNKQFFEHQIQNLTKQFCGASKQKIIVQNRRSLIINKSEILKQFGNVQLHQQQYNLVKMFKVLQQDNESSKIQRLKKYKMDIISKEFPLLAYIVNFKQMQNLKHYYHILIFISKLNVLNLKINRSDSNQSILKIVQQYFCQEQSQKDLHLNLMKQCIRSWNQLVKNKYRLKDGCNFIGYLQQIDEKMSIKHFILDKNNLQNIQSKKLAQFISTITNKYNQICQIMQNLAEENNYKFMSQFKMNPTTFNGQNYLQLPFNIMEQWLSLYSYHSVEYGLKEMQYQLQKINSLVMKKITGCKYFITNKEQFQYIQFIGEDNSFMIFIREDEQLALQPSVQQKLIQYFKKQQKNRGQTFYKFIKQLMGSLQNLIVCFKNKRNFSSATIGQFINEFRIVLKVKNFNKQLNEDPIQSLPIYNVGALYQLLQGIAFNYNAELLNPIYCQPLQEYEIRTFEPFFQKIKNKISVTNFPTLSTFKCVVQRFISRILLSGSVPNHHLIASYLCEIYWLWPKNYVLENYNKELKNILAGVETRKIYGIMKLIEKVQSKNQQLNVRQENIVKKVEKQVKPLKKMVGNKNRKQKNALD